MSNVDGADLSLAEHMELPRRQRRPRWSDSLPDDIIAQIMESDATCSQVSNWLVAIGYPDATHQKMQALIRDRTRARSGRG